MYLNTEFDKYLNHITSKLTEYCGIELDRIAKRTHFFDFPIDLKPKRLALKEKQKDKISPISAFLNDQLTRESNILWLKINVIDQAVNDYVGMGYLKQHMDWLEFALSYLSYDRAEESGDSLFVILPTDFKWAINICLCQDDQSISIESYGI